MTQVKKVNKLKAKKKLSQKVSKPEKVTQKQLIIMGTVIAIITVALIYAFFNDYIWSGGVVEEDGSNMSQVVEEESLQIENMTEAEIKFRHPLTGMPVAEEVERPAVYVVMVENMVEAWPLSGIDQAFLVIEAPVEAAIPRLLSFYYQGQEEVEQIGPVRSARPYYLDWSQGLEAMYVHVGGSPEALSIISDQDLFNLNQFFNGQYFWRSENRLAPHNVYTSTELLSDAYLEEGAWRTMGEPNYDLWTYKVDLVKERRPEPHMISMIFSAYYGELYQAGWEYDPDGNDYVRYQSGDPMSMLNGSQVRARNIAVVETDITVIDNIGRREIVTFGEGDALVFQDGQIIEATWLKTSEENRLRFYDKKTGFEISWNAGTTWIEVLDDLEIVEIL